MFRRVLLLVVIFLISILSGCNLPKGKPVQDKMIVTIVGIDKENDLYTMTILTQLTTVGASEGGQECSKTKIFTESGKTLFDIARNMHSFADYDLFFGNLKFIIIGEKLARNGIGNSLDFLVRDHEHRLTANVMVSIGTTAKDFIETTDMTSAELTDKLDNLFNARDSLSQTKEVTMLDLTKMMDSDTTQILLPCVNKVDKSKKLEARNEVGQLDANLNGYALFKRDKLVVIAKDKMARGINWLIDEIKSGIILANDPEGSLVSLEIIDAETKIVPSDEEMSFTIEVKFTTNVGEILGNVDIFTEDIINELTIQQEKMVEQEISDAFELMREHKSDVIGLGDAFYHKDPIEWNGIKDDWCNIFAEIPYSIKITSRINRTYVITPPVEKKSEGSK